MMSRVVALVPARSGSKRIRDKNVRSLAGHPLMAYSIASALESGVFTDVLTVTDDPEYADIAEAYGSEVPELRPASTAQDDSPDISWVNWMLRLMESRRRSWEAFAILRPTSPFRSADEIKEAWATFAIDQGADSLRAVRQCREHPGKMWAVRQSRMQPLLAMEIDGVPWHSNQSSKLPNFYVQDGSLEISRTDVPLRRGQICGAAVIPFITDSPFSVDLNTELDWLVAECLVERGLAHLPPIRPGMPSQRS